MAEACLPKLSYDVCDDICDGNNDDDEEIQTYEEL